jgi:hypothetical protein
MSLHKKKRIINAGLILPRRSKKTSLNQGQSSLTED